MAEPTPEDLAAFNAEVQNIIDRAAAEGETLTNKEAATRFGNLLKNYAEDPEGVDKQLNIGRRVDELERQVLYILDKIGREVVGPDPDDPDLPPIEPR